VMGYENLLIHLNNKLGIKFGETTPDGKFTLLSNTCLGNCDKAPCIMIDEKTFDNVTIEMLDKLLNELMN
jgi:NADH-quinone oxidoreductase subunit E